ncbi:MAG: 3'-5' exonuclease [Aliidongia sp.]
MGWPRSPGIRRRPAPSRIGANSSAWSTNCVACGAAGPADLEQIRRWYEPRLERLHEEAPPRLADLLQLEQIAAGYASRERFLTELTLDPPDATSDEAGVPCARRRLSDPLHHPFGKGQEWKTVFVLNAVDGCIPSDLGAGTVEDIEEERRLIYVAMTRARDQLHLVMPHRFYVHQQGTDWRPACLCRAHPVHPARAAPPVRKRILGPDARRRRCRAGAVDDPARSGGKNARHVGSARKPAVTKV